MVVKPVVWACGRGFLTSCLGDGSGFAHGLKVTSWLIHAAAFWAERKMSTQLAPSEREQTLLCAFLACAVLIVPGGEEVKSCPGFQCE